MPLSRQEVFVASPINAVMKGLFLNLQDKKQLQELIIIALVGTIALKFNKNRKVVLRKSNEID